MTINLGSRMRDYALYTPACSTPYVNGYSMWNTRLQNPKYEGRKDLITRFKTNGEELNFLNPDNGCYHYPIALYSAGHSGFNDIEKSKISEKMIFDAKQRGNIIIADSGGFNLGISASSMSGFNLSDLKCQNNDKIRLLLIKWLESVSTHSMTLDLPTRFVGKFGLDTFADCLNGTIINLDFFVKHRTPGATKFLNILQGRNEEEGDIWYNTVKNYPFEGWAFAGQNVLNYSMMLKRLITMRDEKKINKNQNWIHILGTSRLQSSCLLTTIQRALRKNISEDITISYDSSTPFIISSKGYIFTQTSYKQNGKDKRFSLLTEPMIQNVKAVGSNCPFPFNSAPGEFLNINDICIRDPKKALTKTTFDSLSYNFLSWHNNYKLINTIIEVNQLQDMPSETVKRWIPNEVLEFKDLCVDIFTSETPYQLIDDNSQILSSITGAFGRKNTSTIKGSKFFDYKDCTISNESFNDAIDFLTDDELEIR